MIGNNFDRAEEAITGVVLSTRHYNNKISIWTKDFTDSETNLKVG